MLDNRKFALTVNSGSEMKHGWKKSTEFTLEELQEHLTSFLYRERKDGPCFVPGAFVGDSRKAAATQFIDILVYDVDGTQSFEQLDELIEKAGVYAILYSTYSHMNSVTEVKTDKYERWAQKSGNAFPPKQEDMKAFLKSEKKGYLTNIQFDLAADRKKHLKQTDSGLIYFVHHDPVEKYRVVFPLEERIVLSELASTTNRCIDTYKSIYCGVGKALGLDFDTACSDPSRLFYFPTARTETSPKRVVGYELDSQKLLDYKVYPRQTIAREDSRTRYNSEGKAVQRTSEEYLVQDRNGRPINLLKWNYNNPDFDIESLMTTCLPEGMVRKERPNGGYIIECPFEHEHTKEGGEGTFCANSSDDSTWMIFCSHNSCQSSDRKKLDFLAEYIKHGYITAEDLGIDDKPEAVVTDEGLASLGIEVKFDSILDSVKDDDIEFVLKDYENKSSPEDGKLGDDELIELCYSELKKADTKLKVGLLLSRLRKRFTTLSLDDIAECLSKGPLSGVLLKTIFRSLAREFGEDSEFLIKLMQEERLKIRPIDDEISTIYNNKETGYHLNKVLAELAVFYGYTLSEIHKRYESYVNDVVLQERGDMMAEHFTRLTNMFAKIRQGSSVAFLDKPASLKEGDAVIISPSGLSTWLRNKNVDILAKNNKSSRIYLFDAWTEECPTIEEYNGVTFVPGGNRVSKDNRYNIWDDWRVPSIAGTPTLVLDHIKRIWCQDNMEVYNWVITWFAHMFQKPEQKPHTAIALIGGQGTGKSSIFEHGFAKILGNYYGVTADRESIVGRFSGHLVGKMMWLSEETLFSGDKRAMNMLKDRISRSTVDIEKKGVDKFTIPSYTRFVFTSNQPHAMHLELDDRRFCVLDTRIDHVDDIAYFQKMVKYLSEENGAEHMLHYFNNWKPEDVGLTWDALYKAPMTEAKERQIEMSVDAPEEFFMELLRNGRISDPGMGEHKISWPLDSSDNNKYSLTIRPDKMKEAFNEYLKIKSGNLAQFSRNKFNTLFYYFFNLKPDDANKPVRVNGKLTRMICLPPRRQILEEVSFKKKHFTRAQIDRIYETPDSHIYTNDSDVL